MKNIDKNMLLNTFEDIMGNIMVNSGSVLKWGEIQMPDCLREEFNNAVNDNECSLSIKKDLNN